MSKADRVAVRVKHKLFQLNRAGLYPKRIILGSVEMYALKTNPQPCCPPDYSEDKSTFCGVPVVEARDIIELVAYEL